MLEVTVFLNSAVEQVIDFKCCSISDQNIEIHFKNNSSSRIKAPKSFVLENDTDRMTVEHLYPPWVESIDAGDTAALYCSMEVGEWKQYHTLLVSDGQDQEYRFSLVEIEH